MKSYITITIIAILFFGSLSGCVDDKDLEKNDNEANYGIEGLPRATPNGGKLYPAEEGPVRSALGEPEIDLATFQLTVTGLVDSSYSLGWEEIQELPAVFTDTMMMYCVEGWEVWGNWKGVLIKDLLDRAHLSDDGEFVLFESSDGYQTALPASYLLKYNAMLAYEVNNAPLQKHDGFPLRLIAYGKYGYKWAKWVNKLTVMNESQPGYWEERGYEDRADVPISRRKYYEGNDIQPLEY